jgi:hypothetical protein
MAQKVDTFEHDIADEIRRKEASLAEIQAVSKQNSPTINIDPPKTLPWLTITLVVGLIIAVVGISSLAYYYFTDSLLPPSAEPQVINKNDIPKVVTDISKLSPSLSAGIGRFSTLVEKKEAGYVITLNNYTEVFAYMTRNEDAYIHELVGVYPKAVATSTQEAVQENTSTSSTTKIGESGATSTKPKTAKVVVASSTEIQEDDSSPFSYFSDLTVSNQNMRVYKKEEQTVIYAFAGDKYVLISNTPEGILALKSAILR